MDVRHRSFGVTGEKKLAVSSIGPAAKVKFECEESYDVEIGDAGVKLGSCGRVREPMPIHSYETPSTVTIPSQPRADPSLWTSVLPWTGRYGIAYQKIGNCEFSEPLLAVEAQAEVYGDLTANGTAGALPG